MKQTTAEKQARSYASAIGATIATRYNKRDGYVNLMAFGPQVGFGASWSVTSCYEYAEGEPSTGWLDLLTQMKRQGVPVRRDENAQRRVAR